MKFFISKKGPFHCEAVTAMVVVLGLLRNKSYKLRNALVWRSLLGLAPAYLRDLCCPTLGAPGRRSLRSTERGVLMVPFAHTATKQNRALTETKTKTEKF